MYFFFFLLFLISRSAACSPLSPFSSIFSDPCSPDLSIRFYSIKIYGICLRRLHVCWLGTWCKINQFGYTNTSKIQGHAYNKTALQVPFILQLHLQIPFPQIEFNGDCITKDYKKSLLDQSSIGFPTVTNQMKQNVSSKKAPALAEMWTKRPKHKAKDLLTSKVNLSFFLWHQMHPIKYKKSDNRFELHLKNQICLSNIYAVPVILKQ